MLLASGCAIEASGLGTLDGGSAIDAGSSRDARAIDSTRTDAGGRIDAGGVDASRPDAAGGGTDAGHDAGRVCPSEYTENAFGTCYRDVTSGERWQAAEEDCESDGAHLVVVDDAAENAAVPNGRWIGYSETVTEGTFLWVTGAGASTFAGPWGGGDPDRLDDAYCVERRSDGWHDDNCWEAKAYLCEHDGRPADPSTWNDSGRSP